MQDLGQGNAPSGAKPGNRISPVAGLVRGNNCELPNAETALVCINEDVRLVDAEAIPALDGMVPAHEHSCEISDALCRNIVGR